METEDEKITGEGENKENSGEDRNKESKEKTTVGGVPNRDNKDIVLREDIKSVFNRFGTIKVFFY